MNQMEYIITKIENKNPNAERRVDDNELVDSVIKLTHLAVDEPMFFSVSDKDYHVRTSRVLDMEETLDGDLRVSTRNTVYFLSEVKEELEDFEQLSSEEFIKSINDLIKVGKEAEYIDNAKGISDGHHTFDELYYHRMTLFALLCNTYKDKAWKSWKHHDDTMFDGMFICGINTPEGQYTYHYNPEHWDKFNVIELLNAPEYDGHQPSDIDRLFSLLG